MRISHVFEIIKQLGIVLGTVHPHHSSKVLLGITLQHVLPVLRFFIKIVSFTDQVDDIFTVKNSLKENSYFSKPKYFFMTSICVQAEIALKLLNKLVANLQISCSGNG